MRKHPIISTLLLIITVIILVIGGAAYWNGIKERVPNDRSGLYFRDWTGVYIYVPRGSGFLMCNGPDMRLTRYRKIPNAAPKTFRILFDSEYRYSKLGEIEISNSGEILARDEKHVFYGGDYIPTGDVNTLEVHGNYAKDKNNLYFRGQVIPGLEAPTVQLSGDDFNSDTNGPGFGIFRPLNGASLADRTTFEYLSKERTVDGRRYFAEDKNFVYYEANGGEYGVGSKPGVKDFKDLGCRYYYFDGKIFYMIYEIEGADPSIFRVLLKPQDTDQQIDRCTHYSLDKNRRYNFGTPVLPDDTYRNKDLDSLLSSPSTR
jgi:hypothetical protein